MGSAARVNPADGQATREVWRQAVNKTHGEQVHDDDSRMSVAGMDPTETSFDYSMDRSGSESSRSVDDLTTAVGDLTSSPG